MATSGSIDWTMTRDQIIQRAYEIVGIISEEENINANQVVKGTIALNSMIKSWQTATTPLWKLRWETTTVSNSDEVTGTDSNVYTCIKNHTSSSDSKPITGANWTDYWILSGSTGGTWINETAYTAIGHIAFTDVLGIVDAFWRGGSNDTPLRVINRTEYMNISDKGTTGTPTLIYFDQSNLGSSKGFLWPQPDVDIDSPDLSEVLHYNAIKRLEDFDDGTDTPDFDTKWIEALCFGLGYKLSFGTGIPLNERLLIKNEADRLLTFAINDSTESADLEISVRSR